MWCFEIMNDKGEQKMVFGYSQKNAFKREGLNPEEWVILSQNYED